MFDAEKIFRFFFGLGIVIFCVTVIGLFLLGVKVSLIFTPKVEMMGLTITTY